MAVIDDEAIRARSLLDHREKAEASDPLGEGAKRTWQPKRVPLLLGGLVVAALACLTVLLSPKDWVKTEASKANPTSEGKASTQEGATPLARKGGPKTAPSPRPAQALVSAPPSLVDPRNWSAKDGGAGIAIEGNGVRVERTTRAPAIVDFAPQKTSSWIDYRVTSVVKNLRDDIAEGSAAIWVLVGSGRPVEVRLDNDRIQVVRNGNDGQDQVLADHPVPWAASHQVATSVGQHNLSVDLDGRNYYTGATSPPGSTPKYGGFALVARSSAKDSSSSFLFDELRVTPLGASDRKLPSPAQPPSP